MKRAANQVDVQALLPDPVVSWEDVLRAADPGRAPTRGRIRHLRSSGHLSDGVNVHLRGPHGLSGRSTYFSSLWGWAQRCRLDGKESESAQLEGAARRVESRYGESLKGYLSQHGLAELPSADFFGGLSSLTASELCKVPGLTKLVLAAGTVTDVGPTTVHVDGRSPSNEVTGVDLPAELFPTRGVPGEPVWVLSRLVGSAALVEVLPARTTTLTVTRTVREQWLRWGGEWLE